MLEFDKSRQNKEMQTLNQQSSTDVASQANAPAKQAPPSKPKIADAKPAPKKKGPPKPLLIVLALAMAIGIYEGYLHFLPKNMDQLRVSGRIEGYETNVGAKVPGRVDYIAVREGAVVHKGELIVKISDDDIQAQLRGARARQEKAVQARDQAIEQIQMTQNTINESQLNKDQAIQDADGRILQAEANVAAAKANLAQSQSQLDQAEADLKLAVLRKERYGKLARQGAVSQDDSDQADTTEATSRATVEARRAAVSSAHKQLIAAVGALTQARSNRFNPGIRHEQLLSARRQMIQSQSQLKSAEQEINNTKADEDQIKANIAYLNILSPIDGTVTARAVEPGAVVVAGQTVLSLLNYNDVYLRAYVPEGEVGRVRVGQKVNVYLDAFKNKAWPGRVIEIDPEASFTPENIYFKDDRVKQVFGMKIAFDNPQGLPKPGMPADADILTDIK